MAFLGRVLLAALGLAAAAGGLLGLSGCAEPGQAGVYSLELFDEPVRCSTDSGRCRNHDGDAVQGEQLHGAAWGSWQLSRHQPGGFYLYLEMQRPAGAVALLEVDVRPGGDERARPHVAYRELVQGEVVFVATRVQGVIEVPPGRDCECQDGRLELRLTDAGPDGLLDTPDDGARHLSRGQYSRLAGFCRESRRATPPEGLQVAALPCPTWAVAGGQVYVGEEDEDVQYVDYGWGCTPVEEEEYVSLGSGDPAEEDEVVWEEEDDGCGSDPGDGSDDADAPGACAVEDDPGEGGLEYGSETEDSWSTDDSSDGCTEGDDSSDSGSSEGCGGGDSSSTGSSSSSSGSGSGSCEGSGDSSSSSSGSSACEGSDSSTSSSSSPSCEGDAVAATGPPPLRHRTGSAQRRRRPWWRRGLSFKVVLLGLLLATLRRAAHRRRRRRRRPPPEGTLGS